MSFIEDYIAKQYGDEEIVNYYENTIHGIGLEIQELDTSTAEGRATLLRKADDLITIKRIWSKGYFDEYVSLDRKRSTDYDKLSWEIDLCMDRHEKFEKLGKLKDLNRDFFAALRNLVKKDQKEAFIPPKREKREFNDRKPRGPRK